MPDGRPRTRGDCADGPRPCPWTDCRFHLAREVRRGRPLTETCSLDVADRGGLSLGEVGELLGVCRERIRQVENGALKKLKESIAAVVGTEA